MTLPALLISLMIIPAVWAAYAFPAVLALTTDALSACQTLLERCVEAAVIAKLFFFWAGALIVSAGFVHAAAKALRNILTARRAISALPVKHSGASIVLITDPAIKTAFTSGLFRPRIYISTGLLNGLERSELRAVFLHELKHKKGYDPLRFLAIAFLRDAFFYLPAARHIAAMARLKKEHEADDAASTRLGEPLSLASAMIKVAREGCVHAALADNAEQVTGRIRRLIEGRSHTSRLPARALGASLAVSAALLLSVSMPIYAAPQAHECTLEKCETHVNMIKGCKEHCSTGHKHEHHH